MDIGTAVVVAVTLSVVMGVARPDIFQLQPSVVTGGLITTLVPVNDVPSPTQRRNARLVEMPNNPP